MAEQISYSGDSGKKKTPTFKQYVDAAKKASTAPKSVSMNENVTGYKTPTISKGFVPLPWNNSDSFNTEMNQFRMINQRVGYKGLGNGTQGNGSGSGDGGGGGGGRGWGGGGGGGGGNATPQPVPITWSPFESGVKDTPSWWKAMKPSEMNSDTEFLASMNMLIPFLSPEDQKTVASTIYQMDAANFGHLNPEGITVNPAKEINTALRTKYTSSDRARSALAAMTALASAVGKSDADLGPGYRYLRSVLDASDKFGGTSDTERQTRAQYQMMMSALDPLLAQSSGTSGALAPYGSLVKMLSQPFFSMGQLRPMTKNANGQYIFGVGNQSLM